MKKLIFTVAMLFFVLQVSQAQNKNNLKGPKAKNYKVWQDDSQTTQVFTTTNKILVTGPKAKNEKPWTTSITEENKVAIKRDTRKSALKGPAAKNFKAWE